MGGYSGPANASSSERLISRYIQRNLFRLSLVIVSLLLPIIYLLRYCSFYSRTVLSCSPMVLAVSATAWIWQRATI